MASRQPGSAPFPTSIASRASFLLCIPFPSCLIGTGDVVQPHVGSAHVGSALQSPLSEQRVGHFAERQLRVRVDAAEENPPRNARLRYATPLLEHFRKGRHEVERSSSGHLYATAAQLASTMR